MLVDNRYKEGQCVVCCFQCDLCNAGYVGYTRGHLHSRVKGHPPPLPNTTRMCTGRCPRTCWSVSKCLRNAKTNLTVKEGDMGICGVAVLMFFLMR